MRYEIRRKEFNFSTAPDLTGTSAAYVSMALIGEKIIYGSSFSKAIDAAIDAARMDHARTDGGPRGAMVGCIFSNMKRPAGTMKNPVYVSYRIRNS